MKKLLLLLIVPFLSFTQEWEQTYGESTRWEQGQAIEQTSDGGFIICGAKYVGCLTNYSNCLPSYNNDVYIDGDVYIIKTNENGDVEWEQTYGLDGESGSEYPYSIQQTSDGGYIIYGSIMGVEGVEQVWNGYLLKINETGVKEWEQTYGGNDPLTDNILGWSAQQTSDGGYILVSYAFGDDTPFTFIKTDANGTVEWTNEIVYGLFVQQTTDGGFIVAGSYADPTINGSAGLTKTNENGIIEWQIVYENAWVVGNAMWQGSELVRQTTDGGYILGVWTLEDDCVSDCNAFCLIKINQNGEEQWRTEALGCAVDEANAIPASIEQTSDGGYILTGTCNGGGLGHTMILIKVNEYGEYEWGEEFDGIGEPYLFEWAGEILENPGSTWGFSVKQTTDGCYIVSGKTFQYFENSTGAPFDGETDIYVVKTCGPQENTYGCTDPLYLEYDATANIDDGSCATLIIEGCTDPEAFNYDSTANTDDGSCEPFVYGCTIDTMWNYNPNANTDDGSCEIFIYGCTNPIALNFDLNANTDDGSCSYVSCEETTSSLNISTGYDEDTETQIPYTFPPNNDIQWNIINGGLFPSIVYLGALAYDCAENDPTTFILNNNPNSDNEEACDYAAWIAPECAEFESCDPNLDPHILELEFCLLQEDNLWFNGALSADNYAEIYFDGELIGELSDQMPNSNYYNVTFIDYFLENVSIGAHTIQIHLSNIGGAMGVKLEAFITTESNYDNLCFGCTGEEILGCTDPGACNYDLLATLDNGSCEYPNECGSCVGEEDCFGCIDPVACNYNSDALVDDESCVYCASSEFLNGEYIDTDGFSFSNAGGVTISLWVYDDNFYQNPQDFATYIDFGSQDNFRYVIGNRSGSVEAFFEGDALPNTFNGADVDWDYPFTATSSQFTNGYCGTEGDGWHNVTAVYCATGVRIYINGIITSQGVTNVFFNNFSLVSEDIKRIGNNQLVDQPANAFIDEVRVWSRALSSEEVYDRAGIGNQINLNINEEINLVGYWKLDCSYTNDVTNLEATNYGSIFTDQHCDYFECNNIQYEYPCSQADCNSCDPPEGCMDELACNYDPLAVVNISANCFYIEDYCPDVQYPEYYDCECKCLNDLDGDEVCDELDCAPDYYNPDQDCTDIIENPVKQRVVETYDVLGRSVNINTKNILLLEKYNDGSVKKKYLIK